MPARWQPSCLSTIDMDTEVSRIQARIAAGQLPNVNCLATWYHTGQGQQCGACHHRILSFELGARCVLPDGTTLWFHNSCYVRWQEIVGRASTDTRAD